ncbi:hypothetical protein SBADM41S_06989 [Streptomyces badius]
MWSAVMFAPSSVRSRFSSRTFRLYGRRAEPSTLSSLKISYDSSPTRSVLRASKLFADTTVSFFNVRVYRAAPHWQPAPRFATYGSGHPLR